MTYSKDQLDFIQKRLIACVDKIISFDTWKSHALLAGYNVEEKTGKMYRQKDNVRTYYV